MSASHYVEVARALQARGDAPAWLQALREEGLSRFQARGLPTPRDEEWKYTPVATLSSRPFQPVRDVSAGPDVARAVERLALPGPRLVFVDGRFVPALSVLLGLPRGVVLKPLSQALREDGALLQETLGRTSRPAAHAFTALNAALLEEGALLTLAPRALSEVPVQLVFLARGGDGPVLASPRVVVVAGEGSEATLVETYAGLGPGATFTNAVTEVSLGDNASLRHFKLQAEGDAALHLGGLYSRQGRDSRFQSHAFSFGGLLARNEVHAAFAGEGGECVLNGLFVGRGSQHLDHRTDLDHAVPHCSSRELYKGVLDDRARGTFHGRIRVREDAQKTDASQQSRNLLLSEGAQVDARPQLEILADDVKCAHGTAVGRLDDNALFYLRSRGIPKREAERMLTQAFASELVRAVPEGPVRARVEALLAEKLPGSAEVMG